MYVLFLSSDEGNRITFRYIVVRWSVSKISDSKLARFYVADQSNSSIEKAGLLGSMTMRLLPTDDKCRLRGTTLEQTIKIDRATGLIPCYVSSLTSTCQQTNKQTNMQTNNRMQTRHLAGRVHWHYKQTESARRCHGLAHIAKARKLIPISKTCTIFEVHS